MEQIVKIARRRAVLLLAVIFVTIIAGCAGNLPALRLPFARPTSTPYQLPPTSTELPTATATTTQQPSPTPSATPASPPRLWIASYLPEEFKKQVVVQDPIILTDRLVSADISLEVGDSNIVSSWVYALAAPFATIPDEVSSEQLRLAWAGETGPTAGPFAGLPLLMDESTEQVFSLLWGSHGADAVKIIPSEELALYAWEHSPSWAIIPFEAIEPHWKVLQVDGQSPLHNDFAAQGYPLTAPISLDTIPGASNATGIELIQAPAGNRDPDKLTTVMLTGVTALVRGTAIKMEAKGILYPAEAIRDWLRGADILHVSNEIPFYSECPPPEMYPEEILFCSPPSYLTLLKDIGTDLIELTGDHFGDYQAAGMNETLNLYKAEKLPYYGGGANAAEARQPLFLEHNGNRIAFIGCNAKGLRYYAPADEDSPGAVQCDFEYLTKEIARLKQEGYLVIATFQHVEYYTYDPPQSMKDDFKKLAAAGADIVSGSQAHQPHGMEFLGNSFMHFGLGNLFFDQYRFLPGPELDRAFIDRHIFYNGQYIGTELLTIKFIDLAKPRPTTPEERDAFLEQIFSASGWR